MGISSTTDSKTKNFDYPKLMVSNANGAIVLFISLRSGTVVKQGINGSREGYQTDQWESNNFRDFTGELTLSNT